MRNDFHPCTFAPLSVWVRLLLANGGVARPFWGRLARIFALTSLAVPFRMVEWLLYSRRVNAVSLDQPPLFVLGFARSGTTHLQNLFAQDPSWGHVSTFQTLLASFSLTGRGRLKRLMEEGMRQMGEETRPQDNVRISLDTPQEEDVALANISHMSYVHQLSFPEMARTMLDKYVLMGSDPDGAPLTRRELRRWERDYLRVLRKATLHANDRPLMLRNTISIGRVDHLVRLFPNAKFVHIVRNPYAVYPSFMHLYRTLLPLYQLDNYEWPDMEEILVDSYSRVMRKYLADRSQIPAGNLVEVHFEDLELDPLAEMEQIYAKLDLSGWEGVKPRMEAYLQSLVGYRKNVYRRDPAAIDRVNERWRFALEAWEYDRQSSGRRSSHGLG